MTQSIERYTTPEGMVKFLYSPGFGAGWASWDDNEDGEGDGFLLFDKGLIELVEVYISCESAQNKVAIEVYLDSKGFVDFYLGGLRDVVVGQVPVGTEIKITEYDGSESYMTRKQDIGWYTA
jgi:hypothetical protein